VRAIIFDCFGVVITDALKVICDELREHDPEAARQIRDIISANNRGLIEPSESNQLIAKLLGVSVSDFRSRVADGEIKDTALLDYIAELRSTYKTAMLSNIGIASLARRFEQGELARYFDAVVASGEIGFAKPEPESYEIVADRLGVRLDECVFTDDREPYCEGARAVGMQAILYENLPQFRSDLEALLSRPEK
jgi:FMN phosphatase YigB (HAD superfamily)